MADAYAWGGKKIQQGLVTGEINQNWFFCIPIQIGPATEYARGLRHWFMFIILLQVAEAVVQIVLCSALVTALWMAVTAVLGLFAWRQDMNITYICIWGTFSIFQAVMTFISDLLPAITGALSLDVVGLITLISVPVIHLLAAAFAWHLYNDYAEDHGERPARSIPLPSMLKSMIPLRSWGSLTL
eukprot:gb/GFBE01060159.1/.p1 GENE.gb/GFBE01060159.1/~~gb/GFBE01060159.1/.p1  ORF type:complete len:185 (+),score=32.21 gb/GFBE01060159.1/:1-555(+)